MICYECGKQMYYDLRQQSIMVDDEVMDGEMRGLHCSDKSCDGAVFNGRDMMVAENRLRNKLLNEKFSKR